MSIDRILSYIPPDLKSRQTAYAGSFNADTITTALSAHSFDKTSIDNVTVWNHFKDNEENLEAIDPGDLFIGDLGWSARVAVLPGYLAYSHNTATITSMIGAYHKTLPSLADADDYRLLVGAITDLTKFQQPVIQAAFSLPNSFRLPSGSAGSRVDLSTYGSLPPYQLAVFADHQEGADQVNTVAILCADSTSAQQAGAELQKRIAGFDLNRNYSALHVTVDPAYVYPDGSGKTQLAVAVVSVHYPLPSTTQPDPRTGKLAPAGLIFHQWINALDRREFYPLIQGKPALSALTATPSN